MDEHSHAPGSVQPGVSATKDEPATPKALMCGDCGVTLLVVNPCPDDDMRVLHCGCGAEIYAPGTRA